MNVIKKKKHFKKFLQRGLAYSMVRNLTNIRNRQIDKNCCVTEDKRIKYDTKNGVLNEKSFSQ